ncbi:MAG TPA: SMI1/KNR4 family protein [Gemmatimonadales bacterium]|jgi:hypothetical protein|nr:SMI1/KNR4 family protein [Gemmatimonadales bacterium]
MTSFEALMEQIDVARRGGGVQLDPPLTADEITTLEEQLGMAVPADLRRLLSVTGGITKKSFRLSFRGDLPFVFEEVAPHGVAVAGDSSGNFWLLELHDESAGPLFFISSDPPVVVIQSPDLAGFIESVLAMADPPPRLDSEVLDIWKHNQYVMTRSAALAGGDETMRRFAEGLTDRFVVVDLRARKEGTGFVWGAAGPRSELRRDGDRLLFATERKGGVLGRLFGR